MNVQTVNLTPLQIQLAVENKAARQFIKEFDTSFDGVLDELSEAFGKKEASQILDRCWKVWSKTDRPPENWDEQVTKILERYETLHSVRLESLAN